MLRAWRSRWNCSRALPAATSASAAPTTTETQSARARRSSRSWSRPLHSSRLRRRRSAPLRSSRSSAALRQARRAPGRTGGSLALGGLVGGSRDRVRRRGSQGAEGAGAGRQAALCAAPARAARRQGPRCRQPSRRSQRRDGRRDAGDDSEREAEREAGGVRGGERGGYGPPLCHLQRPHAPALRRALARGSNSSDWSTPTPPAKSPTRSCAAELTTTRSRDTAGPSRLPAPCHIPLLATPLLAAPRCLRRTRCLRPQRACLVGRGVV